MLTVNVGMLKHLRSITHITLGARLQEIRLNEKSNADYRQKNESKSVRSMSSLNVFKSLSQLYIHLEADERLMINDPTCPE